MARDRSLAPCPEGVVKQGEFRSARPPLARPYTAACCRTRPATQVGRPRGGIVVRRPRKQPITEESMAHYLDLFSPATYEAFSKSDRTISGFRTRQRGVAQRIKPGDRLICYMTKLSRWIGILEVESGPFEDATPIFSILTMIHLPSGSASSRFTGSPLRSACRSTKDQVWKKLSFTRDQSKNTSNWTGKLRGSLVQISTEDGLFLEQLLAAQATGQREWPVREDEFRRLVVSRVRGATRDITVTIPTNPNQRLRFPQRHQKSASRPVCKPCSRRLERAWVCRSGSLETTVTLSLRNGREITRLCSIAFRSTTMTSPSVQSSRLTFSG